MIRILMVDDTKSVHSYMKSLLAKAKGIECQSVYDGSKAIDVLSKNQDVDLIFLDWEMPIQNGPETLKLLRRFNLNIPIIMMTSKNQPSDIELALNLGASEYMMKPFTIDIVFSKIESVLGRRLDYVA